MQSWCWTLSRGIRKTLSLFSRTGLETVGWDKSAQSHQNPVETPLVGLRGLVPPYLVLSS
jgi:hypothetical protein